MELPFDITALGMVGWPAFGLACIAFGWWLIVRKDKAEQRRADERAQYLNALNEMECEFEKAAKASDFERMGQLADTIDRLRKRLDGTLKLLVLALALACAGCACGRNVAESGGRAVVIGRHVQAVDEGAQVPALPEGETGWLLLSVPSGVRAVFPERESGLLERVMDNAH